MADASDSSASKNMDENTQGFIRIKTVGRKSYASELRLRELDVLVAIDGLPVDNDIQKLEEQLKMIERPALLTLFRDGFFLSVFAKQYPGCILEYAPAEISEGVAFKLKSHELDNPKGYRTYEALRNVSRDVFLFEAEYSSFATFLPPFWLLNYRMWEPLMAVLSTYAVSLLVHPLLFVVIFVMIGGYFHRAQTKLIRGYALYQEHYFWMVLAARSDDEAMTICRQFDPKCQFKFGSSFSESVREDARKDKPPQAKDK
ncbi:hypothetical protein N9D07_03290 [Alphaproteobacteria bacterium]|jgi:hypothetical protein|nr:hypothetical protein [Alphaproteobacteria bacterium]MDA9765668.1 hypothetical protein [Alphaproteobacteria bacterium]MDB0027813.1 hypothetical protein [Alphaproteobacteria bacterium]